MRRPHERLSTASCCQCGDRAPIAHCLVSRQRHAGLTLVELLVVVAILVTVIAGVVPALSPNNEARKIREAVRQLSSMVAQAQSTAARTGRPAGIAFNGANPATGEPSGFALEAYFVAQPPPFRGFDEQSTILMPPGNDAHISPFLTLTFGRGLGKSFTPAVDLTGGLPPHMFQLGDEIVVAGNRFRIINNPNTGNNAIKSFPSTDASGYPIKDIYGNPVVTDYLEPNPNSPGLVDVFWMDWTPDLGRRLPPGGRRYEVLRQPQKTAGPPLPFPRGVGIDTSGSEGGGTFGQVAIMFYPNGQVEGFYRRKPSETDPSIFVTEKDTNSSWIDVLIGRVENAKVLWPNESPAFDVSQYNEFDLAGATDERVEQAREEINWLNPDSRWLRIGVRSGRTITAENAQFDPRMTAAAQNSENGYEQFRDQLKGPFAATSYLESMLRTGGG